MTNNNANPAVSEAPKQEAKESKSATGANSSNDTLYGILAYLGVLVFIPVFLAKDNKFVKFHANQGILVFIMGLVSVVPIIGWIMGIVALVFSIMGIISVINKEMKPLPVIGNITILK